MFGPFFFRAMFSADGPNSWRKEDMRYLAALGFNGIRLFLSWKEMEPERGKLNPAALERNRSIISEEFRSTCIGPTPAGSTPDNPASPEPAPIARGQTPTIGARRWWSPGGSSAKRFATARISSHLNCRPMKRRLPMTRRG